MCTMKFRCSYVYFLDAEVNFSSQKTFLTIQNSHTRSVSECLHLKKESIETCFTL